MEILWFSVLFTVKIMHKVSFKWILFNIALKQIFTLAMLCVQNNSVHFLYFQSDYWNIYLNRNISKKKYALQNQPQSKATQRQKALYRCPAHTCSLDITWSANNTTTHPTMNPIEQRNNTQCCTIHVLESEGLGTECCIGFYLFATNPKTSS